MTDYPLLEANLLLPTEGMETGYIGICSNGTAPGEVWGEVPAELRSSVAVVGSLVVNRDGGERMIINSLAHPRLSYIVLFGEEMVTFRASSNLLQALMHGYNDTPGNWIQGGTGVATQYPSVSPEVLESFRSNIVVLPLHRRAGEYADGIMDAYLHWLTPRVPAPVIELLRQLHGGGKLYYDGLAKLLKLLAQLGPQPRGAVALDAKDYAHLQPPVQHLAPLQPQPVWPVPFRVSTQGGSIRLDMRIGSRGGHLLGSSPFAMGYAAMQWLGDDKAQLTPLQQLLLGVELSRANLELRHGWQLQPVAAMAEIAETDELPQPARAVFITDKLYYYRFGIKDGAVRTQCLAYDACTDVFELRSGDIYALLDRLASENRYEPYAQDVLHRVDTGDQLYKAYIAARDGYQFMQDLDALFRLNHEAQPTLTVEADTFLAVHQKILGKIYTEGITAPHADARKGTMRAGVCISVFRDATRSMQRIPAIYKQGSQPIDQMRENYKQQLLRFDNDGDYSYGERTRTHFGYDQLPAAAQQLRTQPGSVAIIQRFDPIHDMTLREERTVDASGKEKLKLSGTQDPCLTHDMYFTAGGKLHAVHLARAHNMVNGYPENIFGLHDAYDTMVATEAGLPLGDMIMISSRGNILLLSEEQRAKSIIAEVAKPVDDMDRSSGPHSLRGQPLAGSAQLAMDVTPLQLATDKPSHPSLDKITNYSGVDTLAKATDYLKRRGTGHNNPLLSDYNARDYTDAATRGNYSGLLFFQCNQVGPQLDATAVYVGRTASQLAGDEQLAHYLATQYHLALGVPLGTLTLVYAPLLA